MKTEALNKLLLAVNVLYKNGNTKVVGALFSWNDREPKKYFLRI